MHRVIPLIVLVMACACQCDLVADEKQDAPNAVAETGSIAGVVKYDGPMPKPRAIHVAADPWCQQFRQQPGVGPLVSETFVWGDDGTLQNVLVYVSGGLEGKKFDPPKARVNVDAVGCQFVPHVSAVMAGQLLHVRDLDAGRHAPMLTAEANQNVARQLPVARELLVRLPEPERGVRLVCQVHPWMRAYIHVLDHPYFAVTGKTGTFEIKGLPPGEYELSVWHEFNRFAPDEATIRVKVEAGKAAEARFQYRVDSQPKPE